MPVQEYGSLKLFRKQVADFLNGVAAKGSIESSGLTMGPFALLGNPRMDTQPITALTVEGEVEFDADNNVIRFLADARRDQGLGQFSETTSEELRGVLSDETGTGEAVFSDTPTLTTPAIIGRITRNGHWVTPFINVQADHGASGVGGVDQTAPIAAAIQEANTTGRELIFPAGYYDAVFFPPITANGVSVRGHGQNSTFIRHTAAAGDTLTFTGQFPQIRDLTMWPLAFKTNSAEIHFNGTFRGVIENVFSQYHFRAFQVSSAAAASIVGCTTRHSLGDAHVYFVGANGNPASGLFIRGHSGDNPWPVAPTSFKAFATGTGYTVGQYFYENSWCWVCTTAGTTAGSGTLAPPTTTSYDWSLTSVTHGTAAFRAVSRVDMAGIVQESYSYSCTISESHFINGAYGYAMLDSASTGTSFPQWMTSFDFEADHAFFAGLLGNAGLTIDIGAGAWIGSTLAGSGIVLSAAFRGSFNAIGARVAGNAQHGLYMGGGIDNSIAHCRFKANGFSSSGVFSDIIIDAGVSHWDVSHNTFGSENGIGTTAAYGVYVVDGASDNYIISHNRSQDLTTGFTFYDGGAGVDKSVNLNLPLTKNDNKMVVVSGTTYTLAGSTDAVRFNPSGPCTVTMLAGTQYDGKEVTVYNVTAFAVTSGASNIGPLAGGGAGTGILAGVAGTWARLKYNSADGIWYILAAN